MPHGNPALPPCARRAAFVALLFAAITPARARAQACDAARVKALPVTERPAIADTNPTLVVLLTGDGGWAGADEKVATGLRARGAAVVGLNMRSYLGDKKTPDQAATDVGCLAEWYGHLWHRERLMLLGYSRGADIAPFVAARWPRALRDRLNMIALVSFSPRASFKFHLIDLVKDVERDDDLMALPEVERLRGLRIVCIYGSDDAVSGCRGADPTLMQVIERPGGHRLTGGFDAVAEHLAAGLTPPR